jgi:hypothetical protein
LFGDGVAVFEAGVTDRARRHARPLRQAPRHPVGVGVALAHPQPDVFAAAVQRETQFLADLKIFGNGAQPPLNARLAVSVRQFGGG